jgi:hypothetical protein
MKYKPKEAFMQTITCDVCRKKVDEPVTGLSFFYIGEYDICESCHDNLELSIKPTIRNNEPFTKEWYDKVLNDSLSKAVQKGKI